MATPDLTTLDEETLGEWLLGRRWFGSKGRLPSMFCRLPLRGLDNALGAMAGVTYMVDELNAATASDAHTNRRDNKAQAYEVLDHLLTQVMQKASHVREQMDEYLEASPELAYWLARSQRDSKAPASQGGAQ